MKDDAPSRDTRLDPLDVVPDPTTPGGVLLPPDRTEAHVAPPVVPPARPSAPPVRPTRPPPGLPSAAGRVPPRGPQPPQPFGQSTQKLGGFGGTPAAAAFRARGAPPAPTPEPETPSTNPSAPTFRRGSLGIPPKPVGTPPKPTPDLGPEPSTAPSAPSFPDSRPTVNGAGFMEGNDTHVGFKPEGFAPHAFALTDENPVAPPMSSRDDDTTGYAPGQNPALPPPAPSTAPGMPLVPSTHRPRLATQPLMGSTAKDVVFLPTEPNPASPEDPVPRASEAPAGLVPEAGIYARLPRLTSGWPFVPIAPLMVVVIGLVVAFAIGLVGIDQLDRAGEEHAGARAELLAVTLAARVSALPPSRRLEATQLAARRSASEILVVASSGDVVYDATLGVPDNASLTKMLKNGKGALEMQRIGRARYAVKPITGGERLLVLVPEPRITEGANALVSALAALTVLLLGVAAGVAYAVSRDVTRDVDFVTDRVRTMAQIRTEPTGELIPARTIDEIGILTATFNKLVARFGRASQQYRSDLARASIADRERAAFLAAVSHELRSPLNAILGFADILMEEVDGPLSPSAKEEVEQIRGSGQHLLGLINDILEFSALESGQLRLARSRVDVLALANEVLKESRGLVGDRPLQVRIEGEPLVARVDARRVRQILGNLVNNAIKFTQQGEVVVRVVRNGTFCYLSVSDTGPGISEADRALIFEEFQQARTERGRRRGTGLGLAITRRLVALHGGTIGVRSELGRGSTFEVNLPIGNVDAPPSRKLVGPATHPHSQPPAESVPPP